MEGGSSWHRGFWPKLIGPVAEAPWGKLWAQANIPQGGSGEPLQFWGWAFSLRNNIRAIEPGTGPLALGRSLRRLLKQDVPVIEPKGIRVCIGMCEGDV